MIGFKKGESVFFKGGTLVSTLLPQSIVPHLLVYRDTNWTGWATQAWEVGSDLGIAGERGKVKRNIVWDSQRVYRLKRFSFKNLYLHIFLL